MPTFLLKTEPGEYSFADLVRDKEVLEEARVAAFNLVETGELDQPEFAPLKCRVLDRFAKLMDIPQTG